MSILKKKWPIISLIAVIVIVIVVVFVSTRNKAYTLYQEGLEAHENLQAEIALSSFNDVAKYPKLLGAFVTDASLRIAEIQASIDANDLRTSGQYLEAIEASSSFINEFCTPFYGQSQQALLEIPFEWAEASVAEEDFAKAAELYLQIISNPAYPEELIERALSALPPVYLNLGKVFSASKEFESAIENFNNCITTEAGDEMVSQAKLYLKQTYIDWGETLLNSENYAEAIDKFELAYEIDISELSAQAWEGAGKSYLGWANILFSNGDIPEAAVKYGIVLTTYSDTEAAIQIPAEAFEPLVVYGQGVLESGDFTTAADTFEIALSLAEEGQGELKASAYLGWGQSLHGQELYLEAIHAFRKSEETTNDTALLAAIQESEQASIYEISQLNNTLGQLIIYAALEDTVPSESASVESTKDSERCFFFATGELCISSSDLEIAYLALGIDEEEARFLVYQEDEGRVKILDEIQATRPGHFRYAAYVVHELIDISTCTYFYQGKPAAYLTRFQQKYSVSIYDTRTGEYIAENVFLGTKPDKCPSLRSFSVANENLYGSLPAMGYIYAWFEEYVK